MRAQRRRLVALAPVLALTLTACGGDPRAELRGDVEAVTLAANDGDADAVREEVEDLLSTLRAQVASREIPVDEAERIRVVALRIAQSAVLLEPEPTPSPTPVEEEPSPTPEPEPTEEEPSPTPEPEPEPTEEPEPTQEPEPTEEPVIEITPATDPSPSPTEQQESQAGGAPSRPSPSPQPTT